MNNKKLISGICAVVMSFSAFAGLSLTVNAASNTETFTFKDVKKQSNQDGDCKGSITSDGAIVQETGDPHSWVSLGEVDFSDKPEITSVLMDRDAYAVWLNIYAIPKSDTVNSLEAAFECVGDNDCDVNKNVTYYSVAELGYNGTGSADNPCQMNLQDVAKIKADNIGEAYLVAHVRSVRYNATVNSVTFVYGETETVTYAQPTYGTLTVKDSEGNVVNSGAIVAKDSELTVTLEHANTVGKTAKIMATKNGNKTEVTDGKIIADDNVTLSVEYEDSTEKAINLLTEQDYNNTYSNMVSGTSWGWGGNNGTFVKNATIYFGQADLTGINTVSVRYKKDNLGYQFYLVPEEYDTADANCLNQAEAKPYIRFVNDNTYTNVKSATLDAALEGTYGIYIYIANGNFEMRNLDKIWFSTEETVTPASATIDKVQQFSGSDYEGQATAITFNAKGKVENGTPYAIEKISVTVSPDGKTAQTEEKTDFGAITGDAVFGILVKNALVTSDQVNIVVE